MSDWVIICKGINETLSNSSKFIGDKLVLGNASILLQKYGGLLNYTNWV